ncbi:hypothetical protein L1077_21795 [Pseudoalteromonas luteoviolacea]|uniref:hypothetical protein n=1 Tax=Pseudoalteromonas luteoviolacea TaxID=43657 RepID=UPI001F1EBDC3|nr:hypothetical protein [Pseudoalteromonas luteoviolacea]MCF6442066.1 hypothetical protein [Pseudoalteromonas luteoviolacea]
MNSLDCLQELLEADLLNQVNQLRNEITQLNQKVEELESGNDDCFVKLKKGAHILGMTEGALYQKIYHSKAPQGEIWKKDGGSRNSPIFVNVAQIRKHLIN